MLFHNGRTVTICRKRTLNKTEIFYAIPVEHYRSCFMGIYVLLHKTEICLEPLPFRFKYILQSFI